MKIAIVIPSALQSYPKDFVLSFIYMYSYLLNHIDELPISIDHLEIIAPKEFPIDANRNIAVAKLLEDKFDTSIWLDADQTFPLDTLVKLLSSPQRITSGIYYVKAMPYYPVMFKESFPDDRQFTWFKPVMEFPDDELFKVDMIGMGCVRIDLNVFREMQPPWFEYGINPVTIDMVENITDEKHKEKMALKMKYPIREVSEDVAFCKQLRALGLPIYIDPTIQCGHIGQLIVDRDLFQSFYANSMDMIKNKNIDEYEKVQKSICRVESAKKIS
jgi:hypothetical protein